MPIARLAHYSIRALDLERSRHFYERVLGFEVRYRPSFDFPGLWLYKGGDEADYGVVHLIGVGSGSDDGVTAYLGDKAVLFEGTGVLDHIAFLATGVENMRRTFVSEGVGWRDRTVPSLGLDQAFIEDPSGVTIELNFPASEVAGPNQVTASGPAQIGEQS